MNTTTTRPRRVVSLVLDPRGPVPGSMHGASARDDRKIAELARYRPIGWADLLRGAVDRNYAIRVRLPGKGTDGRRLVLAVAEDPSRDWLEVVPMGPADRRTVRWLMEGREVEGGELPRPSVLVPAALARGVEVVVRCDVRLIR